jgi:anthranilate/para-aminobenzoate synthase component II
MAEKKKILVVDNYQTRNTSAVRQIESAITQAGYQVQRIRHSEAKAQLKQGNDIMQGYHAAVSSGSGKSWQSTGKKDNQGHEYLTTNDPVHQNLTEHEKPVYAICGSYHATAQALGAKVKNTGEFNRGKGQDGHMYNHKYGIAAQDIGSKVKDVETIKHAGQEYVASFNYKNKRAVQYHPERTEQGRNELVNFLKSQLSQQYRKAA